MNLPCHLGDPLGLGVITEKLFRIGRGVAPRGFDIDLLEPGNSQFRSVFSLF